MSLPCETARRRLTLRRADAPLDADLSEHVATCEGCRACLVLNQALWAVLGEYEAPGLTRDLAPLAARQLTRRRRESLGERVGAWLGALWPRPRSVGVSLVVIGVLIGAWAGTTLARAGATETSDLRAAEETEPYATIFEASPPGFLNASDPWGRAEAAIP